MEKRKYAREYIKHRNNCITDMTRHTEASILSGESWGDESYVYEECMQAMLMVMNHYLDGMLSVQLLHISTCSLDKWTAWGETGQKGFI